LDSLESEKLLEKKLREKVKKIGGWCVKLVAVHMSGIPDRLCLFPGGILVFVELKGTGKKPTKVQLAVHRKLTKLGFEVQVIDSSEKIKKLISKYESFNSG
jgi:hypothetical protein